VEGRIIPVEEITDAELTAWRDLAARALEPNPFLEPECIMAAVRHGQAARGLALLVACEGGEMHGLVTVRTLERLGRLPRRALTTRPDDDPVPVRPVVGVPLLSAAMPADAAEAMLRAAAETRPAHAAHAGLLLLDRLHGGEKVAGMFGDAAARLGFPSCEVESWERCVFRFEAANEGWPGPLGRGRRERLARRREGLGAKFVSETGPGAISRFLALEASGWKGAAGTAMACDPQKEACFRELCDRFAERFVCLTLELDGAPVAMKCLFRAGASVFSAKTAFDESFAAFGPGVELTVRTVEHLRTEARTEILDPCHSPGNGHYRALFPDRRQISTLLVAVGGALDRGAVALYRRRKVGRASHVRPTRLTDHTPRR
jgi:hypothetical protein